MTCDEAQVVLSARLDGEERDAARARAAEAHATGCVACARFERHATLAREHLGAAAAASPGGGAPDLAGSVLARVRREAASDRPDQAGPAPAAPQRRRRSPLPAAAVFLAAALAAAVLVHTSTGREGTGVAAADLPERVVAAQHDVRALEARLGLVERGWNPAVPERRFRGRLSYRAPETLSLTLDDRTDYPPGGWPANDLRLAVAEDRWEVSGLRDCPSPAQPACTPATPDRRSTSGRPPFSPASPAPLELIMPVQSFALAGTTASLPPAPVDGRPTVGIETTAAQVGPLLDALRPTGNLRLVHPADTVRLRLDEETLVPLRVSVRAAPGADRRAWAQARGYTERAGDTVLDLTVSDLVVNGEPTGLPAADGTDAAPDGGPADGGFVDGPVSVDEVPDPDGLPPGLAPHRTGHARTAGGPRVAVRTWSDGRAWLALSATADWPGGRLFGDLGTLVRRVDLGPAGVGYLSEDGTRLALHAAGRDLVLTGSVERSLLVGAARDLGVVGTAVPDTWAEAATADVGDAVGAMAPLSLLLPPALDGFAPPALRVDDGWVVASFVGAGDRAFLLEQGPAAKLPPPSDADDVVPATVRGRPGRFAPPRGELEWFEGGAVVRLRSLTLARGELLAIADRLAPA